MKSINGVEIYLKGTHPRDLRKGIVVKPETSGEMVIAPKKSSKSKKSSK